MTRELAVGKNEDYVWQRTAYRSDELVTYRQEAKELAHHGVRELSPLSLVVAETATGSGPESGPTGNRPDSAQETLAKVAELADALDSGSKRPVRKFAESIEDAAARSPVSPMARALGGKQTDFEPVGRMEAALAAALELAARAGEWSVVAALASELAARRNVRHDVVDLNSARAKKERER